MKNYIIMLLAAVCLVVVPSCTDLDIPPKNIVGDEDLLGSESGIETYRARLYSQLPIQDFKYRLDDNGNDVFYQSWLSGPGNEGAGETLCRDGYSRSYTGGGYWAKGFELLRQANYLIEKLPEYRGNFTEVMYNHILGEAYFVRAFVFYEMAKRYGGLPLVTHLIPYPAQASQMEVPRSSEEDTWNQVLDDFNKASELMMPTSLKRGYANRYVALAYKSEAMLYAGSVAKYNQYIQGRLYGIGRVADGAGLPQDIIAKIEVSVMGFAPDRWEEASKRYFGEAYKAARDVMLNGPYSLYGENETSPEAQYANMVKMFSDLSSPENIFVREYLGPTTVMHGDDAYNSPLIYRAPLSSGGCVPLDYLELFDGFERYSDGTFKVTDGSSNSEGNYLLFDQPVDFFKNAEPRARAYIIFPGDFFKRDNIEIKAGTYVAPVNAGTPQTVNGQTRYTSDMPVWGKGYDYSTATEKYNSLSAYSGSLKTLFMSKNAGGEQEKVPYDKDGNGTLDRGDTITAAGANGPFYDAAECAMTGLYRRKWLNPDLAPDQIGEGKSSQPFVLMRYAEVLLNAAEAAVELALAGAPAPEPYSGDALQTVADNAVKSIQKRAGAVQTEITLDEQGLQKVRRERRKELFCEYKAVWDIRRWRVQHYDASLTGMAGRNYFWGEYRDASKWSSNNDYRFRGLYPFFSTQARKWFFDARFQAVGLKTMNYGTIDYYFAIPEGEVTKSPYIVQQPNR
jgi:hypothetical protein